MRLVSKRMNAAFQQGQSIAEFLVVSSVLVPMILMIASFANLLDVQVTASKAARFASWEGTVYQNVSEEGSKERINKLILNRSWSDFGPSQASVAGKFPSVVDLIAGVGFVSDCSGGCEEVGKGFTDNQNGRLGVASGLGNDVLKTTPISIPLNSDSALFKLVSMTGYRTVSYTDLETPFDDVAGERRFNVRAVAPMVSGGGVAISEEDFTTTVEDASLGGKPLESFEKAVVLGSPLIKLLGFKEMESGMGADGTSTTAQSQSTLLPSGLGEFVE